MKSKKGFTLIEVLAVLVILSILITFSVVSVSKIKKRQEIENRINVIRSILTAARAYEADNPNTTNSSGVLVSTLLSKGYVDFDTKKYSEFTTTTTTVKWDSYDNNNNKTKREFYVNLKLLKDDTNKKNVSDCGLETDQTISKSGKKLCLKGTCSDGKCNGWDINGKAVNSNRDDGFARASDLYNKD